MYNPYIPVLSTNNILFLPCSRHEKKNQIIFLPIDACCIVDILKAYIREAGTLNPDVKYKERPAFSIPSVMCMLSFSMIIPVKSFEPNSKL